MNSGWNCMYDQHRKWQHCVNLTSRYQKGYACDIVSWLCSIDPPSFRNWYLTITFELRRFYSVEWNNDCKGWVSIQEEIKSRLKLGNACYYSVQNLLSSSLLSKKLKIKIYRTIILPVVLYGCETWLLTLREERWLRVFENRVLRRIFGYKRDEVTVE